jgi:serine/threonine-protein kinase
MAPEQARGRAVDRRADIWAFGVVLYEMLTGRRAFDGDDVSITLASVLKEDVQWEALPVDLPVAVRRLLRRCLQKDPKRRLSAIADARLDLDEAASGASDAVAAGPTAVARAPRRIAAVAVASALAGAVVAALATWLSVRSTPVPAPVERFVITTPDEAPFAALGAGVTGVAISPDGSKVIYRTGSLEAPVWYLRERGTLDAVRLRGAEGAAGAFFAPDGQSIAFFSVFDTTLKRISVHGGPSQTICALDGQLRGASWGPDDTIVFATASSKGLRRVPAAGGEPEVLTKVDASSGETDHWWPEVLPGGRGVLFTSWNATPERSRIAVVSLSDRRVTPLVSGGTQPRFAPSGHLVFAAGGVLRALQFDLARLSVVGNPVPVVEGVAMTGLGAANYSIAADGALVYANGSTLGPINHRTVVWVDRQNGRQEAIKVPPRAYTYARLSPDGTRIALDARDQENDIWIWDLSRETLQRLTTDPGLNRLPVWSADSTRIAFTAERDGVESIYWQAADASGTPQRLSVGSMVQGPNSLSKDGKRLVFTTPTTPPFDIGVLGLEGDRREEMLFKTPFSETNAALSPDGRWLAYQSNESGRDEVYLSPFPDVHSSKRPVSNNGGTRPVWSKDKNGHELFYYVAPDTIMAVPVEPGPNLTLGKPVVVVKGPYAAAVNAGAHYDVSPDGKRFLLLKDVDVPGTDKPAQPELRIVLNWQEELKRLVPTK